MIDPPKNDPGAAPFVKTKRTEEGMKALLRTQILPKLSARGPYFDIQAVRTELEAVRCPIRPTILNIYLHAMMEAHVIYGAGRGWYSSLPNAFELDARPVNPLVRRLEKKFPLLEFTCWSTEQVRAFGHHLLARFVSFVHTDRNAIHDVAEFLKDAGYDAHVNPRAGAARQFTIRERTVVIRSRNSAQPHNAHQVSVEGLLVELFVESRALNLMDISECYRIFTNLAEQARISLATLLDYARERRPAALEFIELINAEFCKKST